MNGLLQLGRLCPNTGRLPIFVLGSKTAAGTVDRRIASGTAVTLAKRYQAGRVDRAVGCIMLGTGAE